MISGNSTIAAKSSLEESRRFCQQVTRAQARNFYYGLRLLPAEKRASMYALYAWMRLVDDIADDEDGRSIEQRARELDCWVADSRAVLAGGADAAGQYHARPAATLIWPAFYEMARRHEVSADLFEQVILGQQQDLRPLHFETFAELEVYCYRVAGVVGLASIQIWGYRGGEATRQMAVQRGLAFQLTNILRDLREDICRGRLYLPMEDFARHGVQFAAFSANGKLAKADEGPLLELMKLQIDRARRAYEQSGGLEAAISPDCRPALRVMTRIYRGILEKIARNPLRVLRQRVSLSLWSKLAIGWRALRERG